MGSGIGSNVGTRLSVLVPATNILQILSQFQTRDLREPSPTLKLHRPSQNTKSSNLGKTIWELVRTSSQMVRTDCPKVGLVPPLDQTMGNGSLLGLGPV